MEGRVYDRHLMFLGGRQTNQRAGPLRISFRDFRAVWSGVVCVCFRILGMFVCSSVLGILGMFTYVARLSVMGSYNTDAIQIVISNFVTPCHTYNTA